MHVHGSAAVAGKSKLTTLKAGPNSPWTAAGGELYRGFIEPQGKRDGAELSREQGKGRRQRFRFDGCFIAA